jgi:solute carrier family 25 iron transporter 28/37
MFYSEETKKSDYGIDILDWEDSRPAEFSFIKHMIAGSWAGIMEHWGMFPFDTVKTHMQASAKKIGFISTITRLYREHGLWRFYKGVNVMASGCIPAHACYFSIYEIAKEKFGIDDGNTHFLVSGLIGSLATLSHDAFITPCDCIKQRMQLNEMSTLHWIKKTIREEGVRALYKSYPITTMMNVPFAFAIVSANENIKVYAKPKDHKNPFLIYFSWAFMAGMVAAVITNPMDVIKTRLQIQNNCSCLDEGLERDIWEKTGENLVDRTEIQQTEKLVKAKYTDFRDVIRKIYSTDGVSGFFRGVCPRMMLVAPGVAISWGTYEVFKSFLTKESK